MSTVIESLKVRNFEGYKDEILPFSAGLNLIKGRNSTGKSTILDAVSFAIYGEAPEVDKKLLVSRLPGCNDISVYIKFRSPTTGDAVEVKREGKLDARGGYRKESLELRVNGDEIALEGDDDFRARVTTLLGASFRQFMNLLYVRQGRLTAILEPKEEQMDSILGITLLRELHEQFDEARKRLEKHEGNDIQTEVNKLENIVIPQYERSLSDLAKEIPALEGEVDNLKGTVKKGESKELQTLLNQVEEKKTLDGKLQDLTSRIQQRLQDAGAKTLDEVKAKQSTYTKQHAALKENLEMRSRVKDKLHETWTDLKGRGKALEDEITEHESLMEQGVAKCPTCGQTISASKLETELRADRTKLTQLQTQAKQAEDKYEKVNTEASDLDERSREARNAVRTLEQYAEDLVTYEVEKERITRNLKAKLSEMINTLKALNLKLDPQEPTFERTLASQIPVSPAELEKAQADLKKKDGLLNEKRKYEKELADKRSEDVAKLTKLKKRSEKASLARQLSEGFEQGIEERRRSQLKNIERRALQCYKSMTDQHTYSAISIDPETYKVYLFPKGLTDQIPATRTGGGHQTLISLALRLALIQELNFRSLLILDEPTYGVDDENLPQLASQLGEASKQLSQTIIVTHHGICEEDATNILNVVVGVDGVSRIESAQ